MAKYKSRIFSLTGLPVMVLLCFTPLMPSLRLAGYSVVVGIVFFFIVKCYGKKPNRETRRSFKSIGSDLKKLGTAPQVGLPMPSVTPLLFFLAL